MTNHVIVLAAGRGLRAGGPKALHVVNGRPWWQIQCERLNAVGLPVTWVVSERVRASMGPDVPERIAMADDAAPMFASVKAGAAVVSAAGHARGVFVLPADVPAPHPAVFDVLGIHNGAAVPTYRGVHGHPVYLAWSLVERHVLPASPDDRLDHLIASSRVEVPVNDASVATNLNTAEDFVAWSRREGDVPRARR